MEQPLLSIITINYNNKAGLERTFKSVFEQNYNKVEYIVIDGGSSDGSKELIEKYNSKIDYWVSEQDKGIYNAMNKGIKAASGTSILFLNSGDEFYDTRYLELATKMAIETDIVFGDLHLVGEKKQWIKAFPNKLNLFFFFQDSIPHPATLIRKSLFESIGLYDENLKIVSDWKWFMLAICKHDVKYKHISSVAARFYLDGVSGDSKHHQKLMAERDEVIKEHFDSLIELYEHLKALENQLHTIRGSFFVRVLYKLKILKR